MHAPWRGAWRRWYHGPWATVVHRVGSLVFGKGEPIEVAMARLRATPFGLAGGLVPVADTPHVAFLRAFADAPSVDPVRFNGSPYHMMACDCIRRRGVFFGITDPDRVIERAEYFLALSRAIAADRELPPFRRAPDRSDMPVVTPVPGTDLLRLRNGHHRAAIYHVLDRPAVLARMTRPTSP